MKAGSTLLEKQRKRQGTERHRLGEKKNPGEDHTAKRMNLKNDDEHPIPLGVIVSKSGHPKKKERNEREKKKRKSQRKRKCSEMKEKEKVPLLRKKEKDCNASCSLKVTKNASISPKGQ